MKKELEKYIKFCEELKFSVGQSVELANTEDIILYGERFLEGKITEEKFLTYLERYGCPNEQFKEYKDPCEGDTQYCCRKCWEQFFRR